MKLIVHPVDRLHGSACVPGDKSLSHRAVLFAALAEGESHIRNFLESGVTRVMLDALAQMGVEWEKAGDLLTVRGRGLCGLKPPEKPLYCGNSATTIRLLAGALAAAGIPAVLDGSSGLRKRPMERITGPLRRMGVSIEAAESGGAPLVINARAVGTKLLPLEETLPVASAQVKSCLLLSALAADGTTTLREPGPSRDHTERMLRSMGAHVEQRGIDTPDGVQYETRITPPAAGLSPLDLTLPGDMSAAAFLLTAGAIVPGAEIRIPGIEINPTRTGLIDALRSMGAKIEVQERGVQGGEPVGDLLVSGSRLHATQVSGDLVVRMIDEFSVFGAAAAHAEGITNVREAEELRYKESDRISTLCQELRTLGIQAEEFKDGFAITGGRLHSGVVHTHGDHRLAMALAVAALRSDGPVTIEDAEIIQESFPDFVDKFNALGANMRLVGAGPE